MSTTDNILGSRDTEFKTSGAGSLDSKRYYTLFNEDTGVTEVKERGIANAFDRSVGSYDAKGVFTATKASDSEKTFFNSKEGNSQAINAGTDSAIKDLIANKKTANGQPYNPQSAASQLRKLKNDPIPTIDLSKEGGSKKLADIGKNIPGKTGTKEKKGSFGTHIYPTGIEKTTQDILKFDMMKYQPREMIGGKSTKTFGFKDRDRNRETLGSVMLPIPTGARDTNRVSWSEGNMNALQIELAKSVMAGIAKGGEGFVGSIEDSAKKVAGNNTEVGAALATYLAGQASGTQNLMSRATGAILNPNMELLFNAPALRNFTFNFSLSPRDEKEGETVVRIIRFFKQGMSPIRSKSNLFLKSPHTFRLSYKYRGEGSKGDHPFMNKFKECALQSFNVEYTPTGNYSTYKDGVMSQYKVSMQFAELEPIFNDDYGTGSPTEIGY